MPQKFGSESWTLPKTCPTKMLAKQHPDETRVRKRLLSILKCNTRSQIKVPLPEHMLLMMQKRNNVLHSTFVDKGAATFQSKPVLSIKGAFGFVFPPVCILGRRYEDLIVNVWTHIRHQRMRRFVIFPRTLRPKRLAWVLTAILRITRLNDSSAKVW